MPDTAEKPVQGLVGGFKGGNMDSKAVHIANNIMVACIRKGMMFDGLCEESKTPPDVMKKWLTGKRCISVYGLYRVAKALNCTADSLLKGIDTT